MQTTSTQPEPATQIDPRVFRSALGRFATGVTVVTTVHEGTEHGMTANAFTSVSLTPPLVLVSVDQRARMHTLLTSSERYGVSILSEAQVKVARHFAGRPLPDLSLQFVWQQGIPLITGAVAHLVCHVVDAHRAGDHTLFIGQVEYVDYREGAPLLFTAGAFHCLEVQIHESLFWIW